MRTYVLEDCIRRAFEASGFVVKHAMNITDVGHMESDADTGQDKMALAAARAALAVGYRAFLRDGGFFDDCRKLRIEPPHVICRATEHVDDMIRFIECLEERGVAYREGGNVYFAIDKFPEYGRLGRLDLENLRAGARIDVDSHKLNPLDFVLWFSKSKFPNQIMQWESPWGRGFPGWHIRCSVGKYLGDRIERCMGGMLDRIAVHHTNELAQSEACLGHSG